MLVQTARPVRHIVAAETSLVAVASSAVARRTIAVI
jgi:hypothetical protein